MTDVPSGVSAPPAPPTLSLVAPLGRSPMRLLAALACSSALLVATLAPSVTTGASAEEQPTAAPQVLAEARAMLTGGSGDGPAARRSPGAPGAHTSREATLVLRDLRAALPRLGATDRAAAESLLARPTDGRADPEGTGYTTKSQRRCRGQFCGHYVTSTSDRASSAWVDKTLKVMKKVWKREVGDLGYRAPLSDGALPSSRNGGNGKFDVYLADVGADLLYGYCSADFVLRKDRTRAGGYCVLDNDFSKDQYGGKPGKTLAVTAAHEFFHAIQFGYDYYEDRWFMESTATWVEERFADGVNDNRQYLAFGQVAEPDTSLDLFERGGFAHYGNWPFWEHLSERYGDAIVRRTWNTARGSTYSTRAVEKVLENRGGFAKRLAAFSAANLTPGRSYPEGDHWPAPKPEATWTFGRRTAARSDEVDVDHMASASYVAVPDATLTSEGFSGAPYRLRLTVDGPRAKTDPTAWLVVRTVDGEWRSEQVDLDRNGSTTVTTPFTVEKVEAVSLTLVNASTRFRCDKDTPDWSCFGIPRDQDQPFAVTAEVYQR